MLNGIEQLFRGAPDFRVLACCADGDEVVAAVLRRRPDVVVLDVSMPKKDGFAVLQELKKHNSETRPVLFTVGLADDEMLQAVQLGVRGVVLKESPPKLLLECVRRVQAGGWWLGRQLAARALERLLEHERVEARLRAAVTSRELDVALAVTQGLSNKQIAESLCISEGTVKSHLHKIYGKLQVGGRMQLMALAHKKMPAWASPRAKDAGPALKRRDG